MANGLDAEALAVNLRSAGILTAAGVQGSPEESLKLYAALTAAAAAAVGQ